MQYHLNKDNTVAVSDTYYWKPINTCPKGVKVLLLNKDGVCTLSTLTNKDSNSFWLGWFPLPKKHTKEKHG